MNQLNVLIHQRHPFHQMTLHQVCNAHGVFRVRVADDLLCAPSTLQATASADLLILDSSLSAWSGRILLDRLRRSPHVPALLFVGSPQARQVNLAALARQQGLWVIGELQWPLSPPAFSRALGCLSKVVGGLPKSGP